MESSVPSSVPDQTFLQKYGIYIGGGVLLALILGLSIYFYFNSSKKLSASASPSSYDSSPSPYAPSPSPYSPSPSPYNPTPNPYAPSPSPTSTPNPYISVVSPCAKYEDDTGSFCSQDGVKAYNNALSGQLNYICQANGKQNQYNQCMQMCQNGQFGGLPMCRACCQAVCSSMVCPPVGKGVRGGGEAGGGKSECATICRLQPNSEYCQQCSKVA